MIFTVSDSAPIRLGDGDVGVVLSHGFTGTPGSVRPWAEAIAAHPGTRVIAPRLTGHGTRWQDMERVNWRDWVIDIQAAYAELKPHCRVIFAGGLSMGGALALRLAQTRDVVGVLLVNPGVASDDKLLNMAGALRHVVKSQPGIASDIAKEGVTEPAYDMVSVRAAWQMTKLWAVVRKDLPLVQAPTLLMHSARDHVLDAASRRILEVSLPRLEKKLLPNSFHVATLDHDQDLIATRSVQFIEGVLAQGT